MQENSSTLPSSTYFNLKWRVLKIWIWVFIKEDHTEEMLTGSLYSYFVWAKIFQWKSQTPLRLNNTSNPWEKKTIQSIESPSNKTKKPFGLFSYSLHCSSPLTSKKLKPKKKLHPRYTNSPNDNRSPMQLNKNTDRQYKGICAQKILM